MEITINDREEIFEDCKVIFKKGDVTSIDGIELDKKAYSFINIEIYDSDGKLFYTTEMKQYE